jgi:hypothetical protein
MRPIKKIPLRSVKGESDAMVALQLLRPQPRLLLLSFLFEEDSLYRIVADDLLFISVAAKRRWSFRSFNFLPRQPALRLINEKKHIEKSSHSACLWVFAKKLPSRHG